MKRTREQGAEGQRASGRNALFFAIFLLLLAVVGYIAWERSPPDAPNPAATAQPDVVGQPS